jgi:formylglycine-generating enzyme required for sulfatase activity
VESVSWNESERFCEAVGMRLPTEAEWEYAARTGSRDTRYGEIGAVAWHVANSGNTTHPVGQKAKNAFGLYDMLGNVREWMADWDETYDNGLVARVVRGGSWAERAEFVRASERFGGVQDYHLDFVGLRCAGEVP